MQVNQPPAAAATARAATPAKTGNPKGALNSDFDTFLKMLTVQMKNQDPTAPMKSADFAVQLATFSGVEQQVKTNDLLASLAGQSGTNGMAQLAGWVGMDARAPAPAQFDGSPVTIFPHPAANADQATLVVTDATGAQVQRLPIAVSNDPVTWAGVNDSGTPFASGSYSFAIESFSGDNSLGSTPADTYSTIREARVENGTSVLVLDSGAIVAPDQITALRQAGSHI